MIKKNGTTRKHTMYFLKLFQPMPVVHISTKINLSKIIQHRTKNNNYSFLSYVIKSSYAVLSDYKETQAYSKKGLFVDKIIPLDCATFKFTINRTNQQDSYVDTKVITEEKLISLDAIQKEVDESKQTVSSNIEKLNRLPAFLGYFFFKTLVNRKKNRPQLLGTYSITSIGNYRVDNIFPIIATSLGLGIGRIDQNGILNLVLSFDHRIIDGAKASEILEKIAYCLENYE